VGQDRPARGGDRRLAGRGASHCARVGGRRAARLRAGRPGQAEARVGGGRTASLRAGRPREAEADRRTCGATAPSSVAAPRVCSPVGFYSDHRRAGPVAAGQSARPDKARSPSDAGVARANPDRAPRAGGAAEGGLPHSAQDRAVSAVEGETAADAREDREQGERLVTSCPRKSYVMVDAAFSDRIEPRPDLATAVALDLYHRAAVVTTWRGFREALRRRSPRLEAAVPYPPLAEVSEDQRREFH
jgi:hypothetical protein